MRQFIILILASVLTINRVQAQSCDIAQAGLSVVDESASVPATSITVGQTAFFRVSIRNAAASGCAIPAHTVTTVLDFPTLAGGVKPYVYAGPPSFNSGYFTWIYDYAAEVLVGTNSREIPAGTMDLNVRLRVRGVAPGTGSSNLNITQGKGIADNASNNFSSAKLTVTAATTPGIKLRSFSVKPEQCIIMVDWSTESEQQIERFEIEFSPDGTRFSTIGILQAKNQAGGATYSYTYTPATDKGFYRLRQVNYDGSSVYSQDIFAASNCKGKGTIQVYPNPVSSQQKLVVNISGFSGKLKGELLDATGRITRTVQLANQVNEVSLNQLAAGNYLLIVREESGAAQSFKIVVTR